MAQTTTAERLLTIEEVADWLRLKPAGVRALIKRGKLRRGVHYVRPPGLSTRFRQSAIENWLGGCEEKNAEPDAGQIKMVKGYRMK